MKRVFLKQGHSTSLKDSDTISSVQQFFDGIAEKNPETLQRAISADAKIELLKRKGTFLEKDAYIELVVNHARKRYRDDFLLRDATIDFLEDWTLVRGRFEFRGELPPHLIGIEVNEMQQIRRVYYE